ncbi:methyl-accepting chemotaxis protein [Paraburkholderia caribensis]|uniref:methyl-accepting chemotaxis protein n=1 Tax=Paraburkholderia caribensis TaxID=75105 RepID=UPI001CB60CF4|nr:methyl-accepting chemotaxis protein [Paraburkholderia caribensis]CAG9259142.1 methyl-accepting chemotaxis protein Tar [Paraburkholderia caribensis]
MFEKITIRARLALAMSFLGVLLIAGGAMGIVGVNMTNGDLKHLYSDQLSSSRKLSEASVALARSRLWLFRIALNPDVPDVAKFVQNARDQLDNSRKAWDAYRSLPFADDAEANQANELNGKLQNLVTTGYEPIFQAIATRDGASIRSAVQNSSSALYQDVTGGIDTLQKKQALVAATTYERAQARFDWFVTIAVAGVAFALIAAALAWRSLQRAIGGPLQEALAHFKAIASGDLTARVEVRSHDEMGQLMSGLQAMQDKLVEMIGTVRESASAIDTAAQEIAAGNTDLSQRTEEQAASLEETASSMEQLTATVRQNADNAKRATQLAGTASDTAQRGGEVVGRVVETMQGISSSSSRMNEIIGTIESIAFQTNILALNAAVEAARAGDQGRGFAVVASEVRTLAQRVATAAGEIRGLIGEATSRVDTGATLVRDAGGTIDAIIRDVARVNDILQEISSASEEQSTGIGQVNTAVNQMDQVTQQNAALVEQASAAAQSMAHQARGLSDAVSIFRVGATA